MTTDDGLQPGEALFWLFDTVFLTEDKTAGASAALTGRRRYSVLANGAQVEDARLLVDLSERWPVLRDGEEVVGERHRSIVRLWGREYRIRRSWFSTKVKFEIFEGERLVLRGRETSERAATVRKLRTDSDPELDPVITVALLVVLCRPDRMMILNEVIGH